MPTPIAARIWIEGGVPIADPTAHLPGVVLWAFSAVSAWPFLREALWVRPGTNARQKPLKALGRAGWRGSPKRTTEVLFNHRDHLHERKLGPTTIAWRQIVAGLS